MSIANQFQPKADSRVAPLRSPPQAQPKAPAIHVKTEDVVPNAKGKAGRPKSDNAKEQVSLRLDPRILTHYRSSGEGWQSRLNADLLGLCGL